MRRTLAGVAAGLLAAGLGVAVAELLAAATRPAAGPLVAVGGAVIDATPTPVKELAVRELGTNDKPVLLTVIVVVIAAFTAAVGALSVRRRWVATAGAAVFGIAGAGAALSRPASIPLDALPSLVGAGVAWIVVRALTGMVGKPAVACAYGVAVPSELDLSPGQRAGADPGTGTDDPAADVGAPDDGPAYVDLPVPAMADFDRRAFLRAVAIAAAGAAVTETGAIVAKRARGGAIAESRGRIRLPTAALPAEPLPAGVAPGFTTPNAGFYRVDTALTVPAIDVGTWSLRIHGMVGRAVHLSYDDLLKRPLIERYVTLNCVSNEVGGPYIGTARWLGVPLAPLLMSLGIGRGADQVVARSVDGMTIGTPVATLLDGRDAMLCVGMNGEPLPLVHGFPVRMLTPGLYGYAGSCKWLSEIELTTFARFDAYWVRRGWAARGVVKTASRIDRPRPFTRLAAGTVTVAGVAWAQRRGIKSVQVRVDDGPWAPAELSPVRSVDTWVPWRYAWRATPGPHMLAVRATDRTGALQTGKRATPFPSGATGWHTVSVTVG